MSNVRSPELFCMGVVHHEEDARNLREKGDAHWVLNGLPLATYGGGGPMPEGRTPLLAAFLSYFENRIPGVGLDVAGGNNARALQDLRAFGIITEALVTNFQDLRSPGVRGLPWLGHVDGDLIDPKTWQKIREWKDVHAPEGFSVVLHEPIGALQRLPRSFYLGAIHTLIDWTAKEGALLVQVPPSAMDKAFCLSVRARPDVADVRANHDAYPTQTLIIKS